MCHAFAELGNDSQRIMYQYLGRASHLSYCPHSVIDVGSFSDFGPIMIVSETSADVQSHSNRYKSVYQHGTMRPGLKLPLPL